MLREYNGAVPKAHLTFALGGTTADLTIICDDLTGWPVGTHPFFVVIDRAKPTEEKILCSARSTNVLTVWSDGLGSFGRAKDDTPITAHGIDATIEHIFTATDAAEANAHSNSGTGAHGYPPIADIVVVTDLIPYATDADLAAHAADTSTHGVTSDIVGRTESQVLTNKTMSGASNTFTNIPEAAVTGLASDLAQKSTDLTTHAADTSTHGISSDIVGRSEVQTLTNKTIDYTQNTITNLPATPGPTGPAGPAGADGADGPPGSIIYQPTAPVSPTDGMVWVDSDAVVAGVNTLDALTDVTVTAVADNDSLTWDAGTSQWVNSAGGGGGGGATGGGTDQVFYENDQTVNTNYTITAGKNAVTAGPVSVASGITVTVPSGSTWTVV